jgi:hypothetical protein
MAVDVGKVDHNSLLATPLDMNEGWGDEVEASGSFVSTRLNSSVKLRV